MIGVWRGCAAQNNIDVVRESSVWRLLVMANISLPHHRRTLLQLLFTMIAGGAPVECEDTHDAGDDAQVVISAAEISAVAQRVLCMVRPASHVPRERTALLGWLPPPLAVGFGAASINMVGLGCRVLHILHPVLLAEYFLQPAVRLSRRARRWRRLASSTARAHCAQRT